MIVIEPVVLQFQVPKLYTLYLLMMSLLQYSFLLPCNISFVLIEDRLLGHRRETPGLYYKRDVYFEVKIEVSIYERRVLGWVSRGEPRRQ